MKYWLQQKYRRNIDGPRILNIRSHVYPNNIPLHLSEIDANQEQQG